VPDRRSSAAASTTRDGGRLPRRARGRRERAGCAHARAPAGGIGRAARLTGRVRGSRGRGLRGLVATGAGGGAAGLSGGSTGGRSLHGLVEAGNRGGRGRAAGAMAAGRKARRGLPPRRLELRLRMRLSGSGPCPRIHCPPYAVSLNQAPAPGLPGQRKRGGHRPSLSMPQAGPGVVDARAALGAWRPSLTLP